MADFNVLMNKIADLSSKMDALIAKANQPVPAPVDDQPQVDAAAAAVDAVIAKMPA